MNKLLLWASPVLCCLFTTANAVFAQDTAFTYQGRLNNNGSPANGSYDLTFTLFNANSNGVAVAQTVTNQATAVANGLFTAIIDFGGGVFTGSNYWLEIGAAPQRYGRLYHARAAPAHSARALCHLLAECGRCFDSGERRFHFGGEHYRNDSAGPIAGSGGDKQ